MGSVPVQDRAPLLVRSKDPFFPRPGQNETPPPRPTGRGGGVTQRVLLHYADFISSPRPAAALTASVAVLRPMDIRSKRATAAAVLARRTVKLIRAAMEVGTTRMSVIGVSIFVA